MKIKNRVSLSFLAICLLALSACSSEISTPDNSAISPNGKYIAVVYSVSNGATSGEVKVEVSSRRLYTSVDQILNNKKIYEVDSNSLKGENATKVQWVDNSHIKFNNKVIQAIK